MFIRLFLLFTLTSCLKGDFKPCALRDLGNDKKVCVCNSTYCDTLEQVVHVDNGSYFLFVSSKEGLRFNKSVGNYSDRKAAKDSSWFLNLLGLGESVTITVDTSVRYQQIIGFGGAITDAVGINLLSVDNKLRKHLLRSYYSEDGAEYSLLRMPIGGTDFSQYPYSYDDGSEDPDLTNFKLSAEDFKYRIPFIKQVFKMSPKEVKVLTSTWSPPTWMKTNGGFTGYSALKPQHYITYANYIIKFLDEYKKLNITVWALSTGNEPLMGYLLRSSWNSLGWSPSHLATWTSDFLGPLLRDSDHKHVLLMGFEDSRYGLPFYWDLMIEENESVLKYVDCIAVHWYTDFITFTSTLEWLHNKYPDKCIMYTEACQGYLPWQSAVDIGSWSRGQSYIVDIIKNVNAWASSWVDWNIALNLEGGPSWAQNYVDSPIIVNKEANEFYKQPMYYAMAHVSKYTHTNTTRVDTQPTTSQGVHTVSLLNPDGSLVIILCNTNSRKMVVSLKITNRRGWINLAVPESAFVTIVT